MEKREVPVQPAKELFNKMSNLQRFIHKNEEQFGLLTGREVEVLTLMAKGLKNPAIAKQLDISRATVQNHRSSIRQKLDIGNQVDYIKYALAFGLISF